MTFTGTSKSGLRAHRFYGFKTETETRGAEMNDDIAAELGATSQAITAADEAHLQHLHNDEIWERHGILQRELTARPIPNRASPAA
jgi:hypothetical protein